MTVQTIPRDLIVRQGAAFTEALPYAGVAGRGQRMHIRTATSAATVVRILSHNGDANSRVIFDGSDSIVVTIGASISALWLVGADRVEWVYDIEDYSLSDVDDVEIPYSGKVIVYGNRTRESDVTPSDQMPSGDGRYVRFDGVQGLSAEQQLQARENIGAGTGGGGSGSGDVVGPASSTDGRIAEFDGITGKLLRQSSYTITTLLAAAWARASHTGTQLAATISDFTSAAAAAAPVQSVAGRTGAVVIAVADVSGAESTANKAQPSGYASLDSGGKVPQAQIPAIAITEYLGDVASQAAMLALSGQKGDWCTRSDTGATWIITGTDPTLLGSWTSVTYPASPVTSVAGRTGAVTISSTDITDSTSAGQAVMTAANGAAIRAAAGVVIGTDVQAYSATLAGTTAAFTTAQETKLAGIEAAADVTDAVNVGTAIDGATAKTTPVDADTLALIDSAAGNALKKLSWANIKATAKAYFDTLYQAASATLTTWAGITPGTGIATALGTNVGTAGAPVINGGALGTPSSGALTNCTFPTLNQNTSGYAEALKSATTTVNVSAATAPSSGQVLTATSSTAATWQTPSGGSSNTKWVGAGELIPRVTSGAGIDGEELATNKINLDYLAFDSASAEYAQVSFAWPSGFTTFTAQFHWTAASGSGTVTWTAAARCYADDDALDQAQGTAQSVTDTLLAANDAHKSSATSAVTPGGTVAAGNLTVVQVARDIADTLAVDARLIGVLLSFA